MTFGVIVYHLFLYLQDIFNSILRGVASKSFANFAKTKKEDWIKMDPAQITLLVNNIVTSTTNLR
jgi:hypothetical protein